MRRLLPALVLACLAPVPVAEDADSRVRWRDENHELDELPADMPAPARAAIEAWSEWADEANYRMDLEENGRVLLISPARNARWKAQMKLVRRTIGAFDAALPAPEREDSKAAEVAPAVPKGSGAGPLPEDPEDEPLPDRAPDAGQEIHTWIWGTETRTLDTETIVLLVLRTERDYGHVLELLAERFPYLREWAAEAGRFTGFVLEHPLAGAYIETAAGMEEWNPDNEVVNRVAQLLLVRRFGQLPYWLAQGWAWHVELDLLKAIYCFPYRSGFVFVSEHGGWDKDLARRFKARRDQPLAIDEFASWTRGRYDPERAKPAWGVVEFLLRHRPEAFPQFVEELRLFRAANNRVESDDGTWERRLDYEIALDVQLTILKEQAGDDVLAEATAFFRLGERYDGR